MNGSFIFGLSSMKYQEPNVQCIENSRAPDFCYFTVIIIKTAFIFISMRLLIRHQLPLISGLSLHLFIEDNAHFI